MLQKLFDRLIKFTRLPMSEKILKVNVKIASIGTIPFYFGGFIQDKLYLLHQPDSYTKFKDHAEFRALCKLFVHKNQSNNSGDISRLWAMILNIKKVINDGVVGQFAEVGVWRGNTASCFSALCS